MMRITGVVLVAILVGGCGSSDGGDRHAAPDSASGAVAAAGAAERDTGTAAATASAAVPAAGVVLAADGLDIGGGAATRLSFGRGREQVLTGVGGALGAPREQGTNEECPAGRLGFASYEAGLQLVFQDSGFVGWFAREGSALRTAAGIGPGSTLGQLKAAYPATTMAETSLGTEFAADGLYGIVTSPSDTGTVQVMFAGTNCIFR